MVVHGLTDTVDQTTAADRADQHVGLAKLSGDLVHAGTVSLPDIWVIKGWAVDGFCLCLQIVSASRLVWDIEGSVRRV